MRASRLVAALICTTALAGVAAAAEPVAAQATAAASFDRMKALVGDWTDVDGTLGKKGEVLVTWRLSGAGSALVETLFVGSAHQMTTVYFREGDDVVLTHYCAAGNQPHMRAHTTNGNVVEFAFDGGTNLDVAKDSHMHAGRIEFVGNDEIRSQWDGWQDGKASGFSPVFHLARLKS